MVSKETIEEIFDNIFISSNNELTLKCSKKELRKKDKEFIENFNKDDYIDDEDSYEIQNDHQMKHEYTQKQINSLDDWGGGGYENINGKIYQTETYKRGKKLGLINIEEIKSQIKEIKQAIEDSPRLSMNAVCHRYGHWDKGTKVGDVIVQKGFASTSFSESVAEDFEDNKRYNITYYIPTGNKGVLLNEQFDSLPEQEWLTGPGTRQYVLNVDDDEQEVTVLILPE